MPIRNKPEEVPAEPAITPQQKVEDSRQDKWIKKRLKHNMEILKALEEEVLKEEVARAEFNEKLEGQGSMTLRDKFDTMGQFAEDLVKEEEEQDERPDPVVDT